VKVILSLFEMAPVDAFNLQNTLFWRAHNLGIGKDWCLEFDGSGCW